MKIQILGTGCSKQILDFSPMALPALAIDGQVKSSGQVLTADEVRAFFPNQGA